MAHSSSSSLLVLSAPSAAMAHSSSHTYLIELPTTYNKVCNTTWRLKGISTQVISVVLCFAWLATVILLLREIGLTLTIHEDKFGRVTRQRWFYHRASYHGRPCCTQSTEKITKKLSQMLGTKLEYYSPMNHLWRCYIQTLRFCQTGLQRKKETLNEVNK